MAKETIELAEKYIFAHTVCSTIAAIQKVEQFQEMGVVPPKLVKDVALAINDVNRWFGWSFQDPANLEARLYYLKRTKDGLVIRQGIRQKNG